ncbi:MAG TPA: amidohydrolase family protein [Candidatus Binatia bacterium]|nr:amidohydrolase family protein [Candidatus Binatia bacterium]
MHQGYRVIDADGHVLEPPDLWERYIDAEFRHQAPKGFGVMSMEVLGHRMPDVPGGLSDVAPDYTTGPTARYGFAAKQGFNAPSQVEALDIEGIDIAVLYPSRGLYAASVDDIPPRLAGAICRAYNRWLAEFCQFAPARLFGAGMISLHDPEIAVREAVYAVEQLGMKAVFIRPNPVNGRTIDHADFDPLYAEIERMGVPLATHEGAGVHLQQFGRGRYDKLFKLHMVCHAVENMGACLDLIVGGVLERHPRLRCVFLESGAGWASWWLERMDEHFAGYFGPREAPYLRMKPSAYFKRQCFISTEVDERGTKYIVDALGDDCLVLGSDYPHGDGKFPHAIKEFVAVDTLAERVKRKTLWDNPARLYGIAGSDNGVASQGLQ